MSEHIDKIIYINLDHRTDKREQIEKELNYFNLKYERFSAIFEPKDSIGCNKSHLGVLKLAKKNGYKNILILEDDFKFIVSKEEFEKQMSILFDTQVDFDVCMISYYLNTGEICENYPFLTKVIQAQTASGYIVNNIMYDTLIALYEYATPLLETTRQHWIYSNDQIWKKIQQESKWYCFTEILGVQRPSYNDNGCGWVDYNDYKFAYYTCYFGGDISYSKVIPLIPSLKYDCYYFTNNIEIYNLLEHTKYIRIFIKHIPIYNCLIQDAMSSKELRSCPHHFDILKRYDYLCWFDSKLVVNESKVIKVLKIMSNNDDKLLAMTKHPYSERFNTVFDEYNLAITYDKYATQKEMYLNYINNQLNNGFSAIINIHFCCGFTIKKMCDKINEIGEFWYKHIQECGIEDQISFQFVNQKYGQYIMPLEYQETWKYVNE